MPATSTVKRTYAAVAKAAPRPRGRPPKSKVVKSSDLIDDEAVESVGYSSDEDMKSVSSTKSRSRDRQPLKSASKVATKKQETVDIVSSDDDAKSVRSVKSAMSIDDEGPTTPPRKGRLAVPKTPSSRSVSSRKRSASAMTPPPSDEDTNMIDSPRKRMTPANKVRFAAKAKVSPIKGILKMPEVVIPVSKTYADVTDEDYEADLFGAHTPRGNKPSPSKSPSKRSSKSRGDFDSDDGELLSGWEEDSGTEGVKGRKSVPTKASTVFDGDDEDVVFMEDLATSEPSPETDESDVGTRDPLLKKTYVGLPNIRAACAISWSSKQGPGQPSYGSVIDSLSDLNRRLYRHAIVFTEHGKYSNAARRSPAGYSTGTGSQTHFHPVGGGAPIIFTSVVVVDSSHLFEPKMTGNGKMQKVIAGACIAGEWERLVGAVGMVIHQREFKAQLAQDNLSFSTAYSSSSSDTGASSSGSRRAFSGTQSPFTRRANSVTSKAVLACHDIIPVYDARNAPGRFEDVLDNLKNLPRYPTEIPPGSCAVVAYTMNTWGRDADVINVSFNVHWAMVLGVNFKLV